MPSPGSDIARLLPQTAHRMTRREAEPSQVARWSESPDELECKICYNGYDAGGRKPKVLACLHRVCAKCLKRMLDAGESSPSVLTCPFCRQQTRLPQEKAWLTEDDLAVLSCGEPAGGGGGVSHGEVVLSPASLTGSPRSSDCLLIAIVELPAESSPCHSLRTLNGATALALYRRRPSRDSPGRKWTSRRLPRCLLGALCLVYFSSLPVGIYLLMMAHLWPGVLLVSLVPSTLLVLVVYGFCRCLCHEILEAARCRDNAATVTSAQDD